MKFIFKFLIGVLAFILFVVLALVIAFVVLINKTPRDLKIQDKAIVNNKTCVDLGIADTKIKQLIKDFKTVTRAKDIVSNPYNDTDKVKAEELMAKIGAMKNGEIDYEYIMNNSLTSDSKFYFEFGDTTVAYMVNNLVSNAAGDEEGSFKLNVEEVTFTKSPKEMRIVFSSDITPFKKGFEEKIPGFVANFIGIPDKIYVVCYYDVEVSAAGEIALTHKNVLINDLETDLSNALILAITTDDLDVAGYNNMFGSSIAEAINKMGKVGTAEANSDGLITGTINYGQDGYKDGAIGLICGIA